MLYHSYQSSKPMTPIMTYRLAPRIPSSKPYPYNLQEFETHGTLYADQAEHYSMSGNLLMSHE